MINLRPSCTKQLGHDEDHEGGDEGDDDDDVDDGGGGAVADCKVLDAVASDNKREDENATAFKLVALNFKGEALQSLSIMLLFTL